MHPAEKREMLADGFDILVISWRKSRGMGRNPGRATGASGVMQNRNHAPLDTAQPGF